MKRVVVSLALGIAAGGCDSEAAETYDLTVRWNIAGQSLCQQDLADEYAQDQILFDTMEVKVYLHGDQYVPIEAVNVPCSAGEVLLSPLLQDTYFITIDAYGDYQGTDTAFFHGATTTAVPVEGSIVDIPLMMGKGKTRGGN